MILANDLGIRHCRLGGGRFLGLVVRGGSWSSPSRSSSSRPRSLTIVSSSRVSWRNALFCWTFARHDYVGESAVRYSHLTTSHTYTGLARSEGSSSSWMDLSRCFLLPGWAGAVFSRLCFQPPGQSALFLGCHGRISILVHAVGRSSPEIPGAPSRSR